jgi:nucleoside-diphosphate-sugar epimerase
MKTILITGSTGFIGSNLLSLLYKKNKILLLIRSKKNVVKIKKKYPKLKCIYFNTYKNLDSKLKRIKVDTIVHSATHYVKKHSQKDIEKLANSNIVFGNIILDNLKQMKVKKFINFSSMWENYDGVKDNIFNLYSAYKKSFNFIISFYKKLYLKTKFYNLNVSDTFGKNDKRNKLINTLRINFRNNKITNIVSKRLYVNLVNVTDIINCVDLIINKTIKPGNYSLVNSKNYLISDIINSHRQINKKKIKIKWLGNNVIKEKIYMYKKVPGWQLNYSKLRSVINNI